MRSFSGSFGEGGVRVLKPTFSRQFTKDDSFNSLILYLDPVNGSERKLGHNPSLKDRVEHGKKSSEGKTWKFIEELNIYEPTLVPFRF
jgi:hypothetical protein